MVWVIGSKENKYNVYLAKSKEKWHHQDGDKSYSWLQFPLQEDQLATRDTQDITVNILQPEDEKAVYWITDWEGPH